MTSGDSDIRRLAAKLAAFRSNTQTPAFVPDRAKSDAVRIVSDFIAATIVGTGMGYALDIWAEFTRPWGLVAGLMLGSAAGFRLMWQREQNARRAKESKETSKDKNQRTEDTIDR
ncbi:MAG: AtpZ/AtpI family protein [Alphaproteobacteria bacterium]